MQAIEIIRKITEGWNDIEQMSVVTYDFGEDSDFLALFGNYEKVRGRLRKGASYLVVFVEELHKGTADVVIRNDDGEEAYLYEIVTFTGYIEEIETLRDMLLAGVSTLQSIGMQCQPPLSEFYQGRARERKEVIEHLNKILN